jgi:peptidoglycan-associated lipoprotein
MTRTNRGVALALVAAAAMLAACRKNPETVATPTTNGGGAPSETCNAACRDSIARAEAAARDAAAARAAADAENARRAAIANAISTLKATILFDYDASDIRGDARAALDAKLPVLRANPSVMIRISGHADERGSDQYNDALGQRRAAAAKRYLTDNGIDGARITIVSYGETRPAATGADEGAWATNRRAEFEITAGESSITPPR